MQIRQRLRTDSASFLKTFLRYKWVINGTLYCWCQLKVLDNVDDGHEINRSLMVHDIVDDNILYIYTVYTVLLDVITKYVYEYVNKLCKNTF